MIDGHVHLERGPLTLDYVKKFVDSAIDNHIDVLHILDHSHRYVEFLPIYEGYRVYDVQDAWLNKRFKNYINDYFKLIEECYKQSFPLEVKFGLEVCYQDKEKNKIKEILDRHHFDFVIGSVHAVDYRFFDCDFSDEVLWNVYDVDEIYKKYYEEEFSLIESNIFSQIGHPDQIKIKNKNPSYNLHDTYVKFAKLAKKYDINVENNTGCAYRYNHQDIGTNLEFLSVLKEYGCNIITASDAHDYADVGKLFDRIM